VFKSDAILSLICSTSSSDICIILWAAELCLKNAIKYTGLNSGCFYIYDVDNDKFSFLSSYGLDNGEAECLTNIDSHPEINLKYSGAEPQYISIKNPLTADNSSYGLNDYKSVAIVPVKDNNILAGIFCLFSKEFDNIPDSTRNTLESASEILNGTLLRIKTDDEMKKKRRGTLLLH
jgi:hypothetical protein